MKHLFLYIGSVSIGIVTAALGYPIYSDNFSGDNLLIVLGWVSTWWVIWFTMIRK
jgi:hypothetical protein